ncbi:MAG TPA: ERF family protein [Caulobacteraceae bacterium]|jgi:hypothetical protein
MAKIEIHPDADIETSAEIDELAKALPAAQKAIAKVQKDAANIHFESRYASLNEIAEAILPAMNDNGFSVLQPATTAPPNLVQVVTILLHTSGQWLRATHKIPVTRADAQGVGSALTYARRQALQSLFTVTPAGEDDDGEGSVGRGKNAKPPLPPAEPPKRPTLGARVNNLETTLRDVKNETDLGRAWNLAKGLRAELAAEQPKTSERIEALYNRRVTEFSAPGDQHGPG